MRAFYSLPLAAWPDLAVLADGLVHGEPATPEVAALAARTMPQRPGDCVECGRATKTVYLLSAVDPNPALEAVGGKRLGARLSELTATAAKQFTTTRVRRTVKGADGKAAPVEMAVPSTAVLDGDAVLDGPPALRMLYAGDDPADLL
jgi:hypothetical protein